MFTQEIYSFLLENEIPHNMLLNISFPDSIVTEIRDPGTSKLIMVLIEREKRPWLFSLSPHPELAAKIFLTMKRDSIPTNKSLVASKEIIEAFEKLPEFSSKFQIKVNLDLGLYSLSKEQLKSPPLTKGKGHLATLSHDIDKIAQYYREFQNEAHPHPSSASLEEFREKVLQDIQEKKLILWEDQEDIVSIALNNRNTPTAACIASVYTPVKYRGQGYASCATFALSHHIFSYFKKEKCCLYTDLSNPTSNKIYQALGYERIGSFKEVTIQKSSATYQF